MIYRLGVRRRPGMLAVRSASSPLALTLARHPGCAGEGVEVRAPTAPGESTLISLLDAPDLVPDELIGGVHGSDDGDGSPELLVDHEPQDAEHGGPPVVELDAALEELLFVVEGVPAEVQPAVPQVAGELVAGAGDVLHEGNLHEADQGEDLGRAADRDGIVAEDGRQAVGERLA